MNYFKAIAISLTAALTLLISATGPAQADDLKSASEALVECQKIKDAAERFACLEAATAEISRALSETETESANQTAPAPTETEIANASSITPQQTTQENVDKADANQQEFGRRRLLPSWVPNVSIGRPDPKDKEPDRFDITVTRIQRNKLGRHFFTTSDGQVWRQIQIDEIRAPKSLPAPAQLKRAPSGAIRIEVDGTGRSYNVNRIE